jgi:hypothetical protein
MSRPDCLAFQRAVFEAGEAGVLEFRPELASHPAGCDDCRAWLAAFVRGSMTVAGLPGFAAGVIARTAPAPCARARHLSAAAFDGPLPDVDRMLVAEHLDGCAACRAVVAEMTACVATMPELAAGEPDAGFYARVLAATSRRPERGAWWGTVRRRWNALVNRPRFALEAAYALTLCLVLATGNPLAAVEWTAARVEQVAARVETVDRTIHGRLVTWRSRVAMIAPDARPGPSVRPFGDASWFSLLREIWDRVFSALERWVAALGDACRTVLQRAREWGRDAFGPDISRDTRD